MDTTTQQPNTPSIQAPPEFEEMMNAGVFYGSTKTKTHPRMKQYVTATRNGVEIIDLEKTSEMLESALRVVAEKAATGRALLFVGTQPQAQQFIRDLAGKFDYPNVTVRWLGGTITNFGVISKRLEWFKKLKKDKASGAFLKYTKKEQLDITKEIERLTPTLEGLETMTDRPELLIMVDPLVHKTTMREAKRLRIPVVALVSTDYDPHEINYPVVGNTKARASVAWFLKQIEVVLKNAKEDRAKIAAVLPEEKSADKV